LRAKTQEERNIWVRVIMELIEDLENKELKEKMDSEVFATVGYSLPITNIKDLGRKLVQRC